MAEERGSVVSKQFLMGNEAIAWGAIHAGVQVVSGYPGTPSTEILETVAKNNPDGAIYVEWSVNEKAAMEVAAGAAYAGARTLVTMKQVGLNVASDPLMSLAYVGVQGGMVIVAADDPGPISSQTEQDTRLFARFAKVPVFDPNRYTYRYEMVQAAFDLSERCQAPVLLRPTTRVCHGCASVEVRPAQARRPIPGFVKDTKRWVIFPRTSYENHIKLTRRERELSRAFSQSPFNRITGQGRLGVVSSGISHAYVQQARLDLGAPPVRQLKIGNAYPFPEELAETFLREVDQVLVVEELDPVLERELTYLCGRCGLSVPIRGKLTGDIPPAGENTVEAVTGALAAFLGLPQPEHTVPQPPALPARPPVLCAGCPHRASFYAVKQACRGKKAVFCGDIGCYTLGNAMPLDMVDTCLCMGADVTMAQGLYRAEPDAVHFSFIGDSTFFASGIPGVGQRRVQPGADDPGGAGQFHHRHDRAPAPSGHRPHHDGRTERAGEHREGAGGHRRDPRGDGGPAAS